MIGAWATTTNLPTDRPTSPAKTEHILLLDIRLPAILSQNERPAGEREQYAKSEFDESTQIWEPYQSTGTLL